MAKNKTDSIEFSSVAVGFAIYHNPVKVGLIAKKYAERCGIKLNLSVLYAFKAFQHTEKAICESNCKDRVSGFFRCMICVKKCKCLNL